MDNEEDFMSADFMSTETTTQGVLVREEEKAEVKAPMVNVNNVEEAPARAGKQRMLYRHPTNKMIGGVCGGLADFTGIDATFIRLAWVVMTIITSGGGVLAYLALWMLLPVGTVAAGQVSPAVISLNEKNVIRAAYVLIGLGVLWLLSNIGILGGLWGAFWTVATIFFWPALLIGAGYLLLRGANRDLKQDFANIRGRVKMNVNGKVPSSDEVKDGVRDVRQRIPLKRSRTDKVLLGVCGGIGQRLGIDANLVRLIWAAFSIGSIGMGVLVYVAVGLLLPEETEEDVVRARMEAQDVQVVDGSVGSVS